MKLSVAKSHKCVCKHHVIIAHIYKYNYMLIQTQNNALLSCLFMYTFANDFQDIFRITK